VSADLVRAVIAVESEFDALAVSSKGAQGLMQLMPHTARRFGVGDSFDARQNIFGGTQYLRFLLDLFSGNVELTLAAYNAGENAVQRYHGIPPYRETRQYVAKVQGLLGSGFEQVRAMFFAPNPKALAPKPAKPVKVQPARPRIYYKWRDESGLHVAETPPAEGTVYSMIRALD
jgi:Transglycosylase SLT domain